MAHRMRGMPLNMALAQGNFNVDLDIFQPLDKLRLVGLLQGDMEVAERVSTDNSATVVLD